MDLRTVKTRESIIEAFFDCLELMDFSQITVKVLTQRARVNRSTFYKHFEDKYRLRDEVVSALLRDFETNLETDFLFEKNLADEMYVQKLAHCLDNFRSHKREYEILWNQLLLGRNLFEEMIETGARKLERQIRDNPKITEDKKGVAGWYAHLLLNNMLVSVRWWFSQQNPFSSKDLARLIIRHMIHGTIPTLLGRHSQSLPDVF